MQFYTKTFTYCSIFIVSILFTTFAQAQITQEKKRLKAVRIHGGSFFDSYQNLTPEGLLSMIKGGTTQGFNLTEYEEYNSYATLEGGNIGIDLVLNPKRPIFGGNINQEIRLGASLNIEREAMIDMQKKGTTIDDYDSWDTGIVGLCIIENELLLQGAYILEFPLIKNRLAFFGGGGSNFGTTFNNKFVFINLNDEFIAAKNSHFVRTYGIVGMALKLNRVQIDLESIYGAGWQVVHGSDNNLMKRIRGVQLGISYLLKP